MSQEKHKRTPPESASEKHAEAQEELYAFRWWFARDPEQCLSDAHSREIVRAYEIISRPSWDALRAQIIAKEIPKTLADLFSDYMAGYMLVSEWEPHRGLDSDLEGKPISTWRKTKRCFTAPQSLEVFGELEPVSAHPPHREHLKSKITRLMRADLSNAGLPKKKADIMLQEIFSLIGERIELDSVGRTATRSRKRKN